MVVFIPLTTSPPSKSLQVCLGTQGGYHAANRWDIVIQPLRSVTLLRRTVIHRGAGGPGRALFIPFAPAGYRSRMLTVEPESVTELMTLLATSDVVWKSGPLQLPDMKILRTELKKMGEAHKACETNVTLWAHLWIDHLLGRAAFKGEGRHKALKCEISKRSF